MAGLTCVLVLTGWHWDIGLLTRPLPSSTAMNPMTAFSLLLLCAALWFARGQAPEDFRAPRFASACAGLAVAIGFLKLLEYTLGLEIGIDKVFFVAKLDAEGAFPNRMAPNTALNFVLSGTAFILLGANRKWRWAAETGAVIVVATAFVAFVGHTVGAPGFYQPFPLIGMAVNTAFCFILIGLGVLVARPDSGIGATVASPHLGGVMARRLLPVAVLFPLMVGWIRLWGENKGFYDRAFGVGIMILSSIFFFAALMLRTAALLNHADAVRRRAEERFRLVVEAAPNALVMVDSAGRTALVNAQAENLFGYPRRELLEQSIETLVPAKFRGMHPGYWRESSANPVSRPMGAERDLFGFRKDGSEVPVEMELNPISTEEGTFVLASIVDISERKRMERELLAANQSLTALFQASPLGVVALTPSGDVKMWNRAAEKIFGWKHEEAVGKPYPAIPRDMRAEFAVLLKRARGGEVLMDVETVRERKDGRRIDVSSSMAPLFGAGNEVSGVISMVADISDHKRVAREREQLFREFDAVLSHMPAGVVFAEAPSGKLVFANKQVEQVLGRPMPKADSVEEYSADTGFHADGRTYKPEEWPLARAIRSGATVQDEDVDYLRGDGKRIVLCISAAPVLGAGRNIIGGVAILRDVTEQRRAAKERETLENQFRQSQKMEAIGALAGSIAHDFNNMLMAIGGYAALALGEVPENSPAKKDLSELQKTVARAASLTQQILTFSRGKVMKTEPVHLNFVLREMESMLHRLLGSSVELRMALNGKTDRIMADASHIQQVVMNLAVNARDAMPRKGRLSIETKDVEIDEEYIKEHYGIDPGLYVQFSVSDTGIGIPKEIQDRIFEPFFTTKDEGKGTGLGLSTTYGIVRQHGGHILVYSELGKGTTFKVYLPVAREAVAAQPQQKRITGPFLKGTEAILLVEDEDAVRDIVERTLRGLGYTVVPAASGDEAVKRVRGCPIEIDLLVTDVVMPGMDVQDMVRYVKDLFPRVKVLFISGYADDAKELQDVLQAGAHFMQKPFSPKDIAVQVRRIFEGET